MMIQKLRKFFIPNFKHWSKLDLHLSERNPHGNHLVWKSKTFSDVYENWKISQRHLTIDKKTDQKNPTPKQGRTTTQKNTNANPKMSHCAFSKHA